MGFIRYVIKECGLYTFQMQHVSVAFIKQSWYKSNCYKRLDLGIFFFFSSSKILVEEMKKNGKKVLSLMWNDENCFG